MSTHLADSTGPCWGVKARYHFTVRSATPEGDAARLNVDSGTETSVAFLKRLRARYANPPLIIRDNGPAHGQDASRAYLLDTRGTRGNTCFGTKARIRAQGDHFFSPVATGTNEAIQGCHIPLQARFDVLTRSQHACHVPRTAIDI